MWVTPEAAARSWASAVDMVAARIPAIMTPAMMAGHKGELFVMDLSFIGWNILSSIPYVGYLVQIWAMPYINLSYALYYEALSGRDIYAADRGTEFPPPPVDY